MSRITRCPACVTLFKVVPDQLRISDGWVRCGQCDEVFDASLHLLPDSPETPYPSIELDLDLTSEDPADRPETLPTGPEPDQPVAADADTGLLISPVPVPLLAECSRVDEPCALSLDVPDEPLVVPAQLLAPAAPALEPHAELDEVTFLRDKEVDSFWAKPWTHAILFGLGLVLLLGLSGQMIVHERDRIAAAEPGLKPWLLALCAPLNCTLSPLRRIEGIVIDSASFTKIRGDFYRLNFMVKNTSAITLALPAIELTLTDSSDQPVVRRVFLSSELGATTDALAAGIEWSASLAVALKAAGAGDRVAGYRVLAFYP